MYQFFIHRPKFAWVMAIFICLAGALVIPTLPVEKYPQVAPPQISIQAVYPGASAQVLNESVTSLIEEELNGAKGLLYYESVNNANGSAEIVVTFAPGTDPALAQVDVQNRIKKAEARLPDIVKSQGIEVEQSTSGFLMIYAISYKTDRPGQNTQYLADYAARNINNEIRRVPGVGKLQFFASESAMRVWVNPQKLLRYNLSLDDVNRAIAAQNIQVPAGSFGTQPDNGNQEIMGAFEVKGLLAGAEEFGNIVLRANVDGSAVHLRDVARLEVGPERYGSESYLNGRKVACAAVQLAPGGNAIQTRDRVMARLNELAINMPDDIQFEIPYDTSKFVKVAIKKVVQTLFEAIGLVFLVMLLFLQNLRYTLIPTIVVPVCLLGTFAMMSALGFSVNMMTMFGMVLAIGILVDDAIVVVENVERIMAEEGLPPKAATTKAMGQISGAVVGITLVLAAVFFPLAFMDGSVGIIYRQFAMSVAVSIVISGFLALTLTPALCASLLKPVKPGEQHKARGFFGLFNRGFNWMTDTFGNLTSHTVQRTWRFMCIYALILAGLGYTYLRLPESFVPNEDQGIMILSTQLPPGATQNRTQAVAKNSETYLLSRAPIDRVVSIIGFSFSGVGPNASMAFSTFKDWSQRSPEESVDNEIGRANHTLSQTKDGAVLAVNPAPVDGMGNMGGFSLRLQDRAGVGSQVLGIALGKLLQEANGSPAIAFAYVDGLPDAPKLRLDIDRDKAQAMGLNFSTIANVLSTAFGSQQINQFVNRGRVQRVVVQAEGKYRLTPDSLDYIYIPNAKGDLVPLKAFTRVSWKTDPVQVIRYNGFPAYRINGQPAPGHSTGEAIAAIEAIMAGMPQGIGYEWTGLSFQEKYAGAQAAKLFALALIVVFLLLVALYESWTIPFAVMLIVPIGALGAVLAVLGFDMANDVYFKVGLITIIGLSAKNAILIAEFARELMAQGVGLIQAATQAARIRFRPIIMTSMAFILGVLPLAKASGAGAASQQAIGIGVMGGMIAATVLGVFFAPIFLVWVVSLFPGKSHGPKEV